MIAPRAITIEPNRDDEKRWLEIATYHLVSSLQECCKTTYGFKELIDSFSMLGGPKYTEVQKWLQIFATKQHALPSHTEVIELSYLMHISVLKTRKHWGFGKVKTERVRRDFAEDPHHFEPQMNLEDDSYEAMTALKNVIIMLREMTLIYEQED